MAMQDALDTRLQRAFDPRCVAIVGATEDRNKVGGRPLHYLQRFGYNGRICPINPGRDEVQAIYADAASIEREGDVARMRELQPGLRVHVVDGAGHDVHLDAPAAVAGVVLAGR